MLSADTSCKAVFVVVPQQCEWLMNDGKSKIVSVRNRETSQGGLLGSERAVAYVRMVARDRLSLRVMPLLFLTCSRVRFVTK